MEEAKRLVRLSADELLRIKWEISVYDIERIARELYRAVRLLEEAQREER